MIQASELRIGSLVLNKHGQVISIECDDIVDAWHMPELYTPIQLTPEILEKAGFVNGVKNNISIGYYADDFIKDQMSVAFNEKMIKVKYVHQFQNLVHALTGEELQIEL